ncbi:hypothetical protein FCMLKIFP_00070 [Pseudomonas phage Ka3]|uniref:Uncharacterized protein n=1 Tax=Pseudomonas phage vB_Pae_AM.P2 TaxID=2731695 RepID=A0A7S5W9B5_9CAUD|nr:hypothetical protein AMP2_gp066 [Pseudomonas phage vB_Pae_AM.P2]QWY17754.1 hypothetical protein [Pseudomonas phage vB_Pae-PA152]UGL60951.1 hypothetical protein [Pseudomonas phage vB_PaeS_TUMS_P6]UNI72031.1 hypothetical protein [Pseudomonas phage vB_PaeP_TUMS_P10]WQZ52420.1 hypothetical protein FCMLKIFP_00070 [Pseudomonas phage Ka3]
MNLTFLRKCSAHAAKIHAALIKSYNLSWIDECGTEHEEDFYCLSDEGAIERVQHAVRGCEGLVSCITLVGEEGEIDFDPWEG